MQKEERQRTLRKIDMTDKLRKGLGLAILLVFMAGALLSVVYLANLSDAQVLIKSIITVTLGSVIFVMFYQVVFQLGGQLARNLFAAAIIVLNALTIYLVQ